MVSNGEPSSGETATDAAGNAPEPASQPAPTTRVSKKRDPWEERERQRERWNRPRSSSSSRRSSRTAHREADPEPDELGFANNVNVVGLLAAVGILLVAEAPQVAGSARMLLVEIAAIILLLLIGTSRNLLENLWAAARRGPNPWILGLLLWSGYSFFVAPFREFAFGELLRVLTGVAAYFIAAYTLRSPRQVSYAVAGLLFFGVAISLYDMASFGQKRGVSHAIYFDYSVFGTHENVGSLLVLLLPLALTMALHRDIEEKRRLAAMAATLVLGGALVLARTRSAWAGGVAALFALGVLFILYGPKPDEEDRRPFLSRLIGSPVVLIALGFVVFVGVGGIAPILAKRASLVTALEDGSLADRVIKWNGAVRMVTEKPITGWGLGSFPVLQGQWTHQGDEMAKVLKGGTGHENIAHNYYVQWAADTGLIGLFLYVAVLVAFLVAVVRALKRTETPLQTVLLCGGAATVVGCLVDAIGSPAYNFHGVSTVLWAVMGVTVAAMRPAYRSGASAPALAPTPLLGWIPPILGGLFVAGLVLYAGDRIISHGKTLPRGVLQVIADPPGPVRPGASVTWRAIFTNEKGEKDEEIATMPGTLWELKGDSALVNRAQAELVDEMIKYPSLRRSVFRVLVPATTAPGTPISARAIYRDRYNRRYEAWSMKTVGNLSNIPVPSSTPLPHKP
jgi:O-antigen ligase